MHKKLVNHCTIELILEPQGPVLIKSGKEGADPTKPNMEFVETYHNGGQSIYFPGSSLKGAIRAHAERIVRTVGSCERPKNLPLPDKDASYPLWASDPLNDKDKYNNPNQYLEAWKKDKENEAHPNPGAELYRISCFTTQLFGSTSVASRFRVEDAYPVNPKQVRTEERNGVAIDRVFGSVAVGPFNYQVCTAGKFRTKLHLKNFTLEQLGLIGLVLRDLNDGWFSLGFAKSRGMGMVAVELKEAKVEYPGCVLYDKQIKLLGSKREPWPHTSLLGAGSFLQDEERRKYGFPSDDEQLLTSDRENPVVGEKMAYGLGVKLTWKDKQIEKDLFPRAVNVWQKRLENVI